MLTIFKAFRQTLKKQSLDKLQGFSADAYNTIVKEFLDFA